MNTPTIKELRALAKRKGMELTVFMDIYTVTNEGGYDYWLKTYSRVVVAAALRALPDKEVAR